MIERKLEAEREARERLKEKGFDRGKRENPDVVPEKMPTVAPPQVFSPPGGQVGGTGTMTIYPFPFAQRVPVGEKVELSLNLDNSRNRA